MYQVATGGLSPANIEAPYGLFWETKNVRVFLPRHAMSIYPIAP